jgi:hypothetical protein
MGSARLGVAIATAPFTLDVVDSGMAHSLQELIDDRCLLARIEGYAMIPLEFVKYK